MRYKEDWPKAQQRLTAFWNQEVLDRCCVSIRAQDFSVIPPPDRSDLFRYWTDPELIIRYNRGMMERSAYLGEAFPCIMLNLGSAGHAGFFRGAKPVYEPTTVWFEPSLEDVSDLVFEESSFLYQKTLELARALSQDSRGDYLVGMCDDQGNADALAHLMGSEEMLIALTEEPEIMGDALKKIQPVYERIHSQVYDIVKGVNGGSCLDWLNTWAPGLHAMMQCDLSVMISKGMFDEFILPELQAQCRFLEYPLYHLDGVEQIRHLDSLLSIPELKAIQWTQVVGQKPCTEYLPELRRIQAAGKSLIIIAEPHQVPVLMEQLSSRGLYLIVHTRTREEGEAILKTVEKGTHD
ncbi:MAG: hypothetical protein E7324_00190 [Clostridiales bacterium]|nr:hypothetical protein [Clostridiales bacterium]